MARMESLGRAAVLKRQLDIESTKQFMRDRGYTDAEIEKYKFTPQDDE